MSAFIKGAGSDPGVHRRLSERGARGIGAALLVFLVGGFAILQSPTVGVASIGTALAVVILGSAFSAEMGRFPQLRLIGIDTVSCLMIPSLLAGYSWISRDAIASLGAALDRLDVLGWIISLLVLSSCSQIEWKIMRNMAIKLGIPVLCASLAALVAAWGLTIILGTSFSNVLFFQVAPMMAGGLTAGALPLAKSYANEWSQAPGVFLAQMLPSVFVANLSAIIGAGIIGAFCPVNASQDSNTTSSIRDAARIYDIAMAVSAVILLYAIGALVSAWLGFAAPLVVIVVAMTAGGFDSIPAPVIRGMRVIQDYFTSYFLFPLLWLVGLVFIPWGHLVAGFAIPLLSVTVATVLVLSVTGYFVSTWTGLDPADGTMVTLARVAMGGTGAIAIMNAGDRLPLLPFALLVTRLGGALTVLVTIQAAAVIKP